MLLHQFLEASAVRAPQAPAIVVEQARYTYAQLDAAADQLALLLQARGIGRGDRVGLFLDNGIEAVVALYAVLKAGAVFMPLNPLTKSDKLAWLLADAGASALVTQASLASVFEAAVPRCPSVHTCVVAGGDHGAVGLPAPLVVPFPAAGPVPAALQRPADPRCIDVDLAAILYTSGSTGEPKGVMLTHLNMVSASRSVIDYLGLVADDRIGLVLPLAFNYGLYHVLMALRIGACVVLERSFAFPVKVLETFSRERITLLPGVPTIFAILLGVKALPRYDLSSLRLVTNAGAALPEDHLQRLRQHFPGARLYSMYGQTECTRVSYLPPDELDRRPLSVGRGMPNQELWLVDEQGRRLPDGSTGELVVRGSHVMRGYWNRAEETARKLRPGPVPGEVVLHSGDLFRSDALGWLYFVARMDDIIKSRGEKVSPREVENAIYALPAVQEAAVIGVPDPLLGQAIKAFVVLREGAQCSEREVIGHCQARLESFMVPRQVVFVDSLPKTDNGKIRKVSLA